MKKPSPYRDPGAEQRYMEAESKIRKIEQGQKKKPMKPKTCPECTTPDTCKAQGRCRKSGRKL